MKEIAAGRQALALFALLFVVYNANGREIATVDSQPAKFTAREIAVSGTTRLDRVIAERPGLAERPGFARDQHGSYRSAYPMLPALLAAGPAWIFQVTGLVDMDADRAPNLVAKLTASMLTAAAVTIVFVTVRRLVPPRAAWLTAIGLGLGTNYWTAVSQTLWQHETVAFGAALALWAWLRPADALSIRTMWIGATGLAMAGAARPQTAPMIAVLLAWLVARIGWRRAASAIAVVLAAGAVVATANAAWFGHPLGAMPRLEALHPAIHGVASSFNARPWEALAGLTLSPSRGLLIFSPIVLICALGFVVRRGVDHDRDLAWLGGAAMIQLVAYSLYSVWWGGHTFGPRYLVDILVPLAPLGAVGAAWLASRRLPAALALLALAWSMIVSAAGAFRYPNDQWNSQPADVDRHHERLWQVRDSQIPRTFRSASSPQNFNLLGWTTVRRLPLP